MHTLRGIFLKSRPLPDQAHQPLNGACKTVVLQPGIEPVPPALEAQRLNHWTTREVLHVPLLLRLHLHFEDDMMKNGKLLGIPWQSSG